MAWARPAAAQQPVVRDTAAQDTVRQRIAPGKAFYRSLILPGWGQFSVGARTRGVTFVALQGASAFMLTKTLKKLGDARNVEETRVRAARDSLNALMERDTVARRRLSDERVYQLAIDSTAGVVRVRRLIASREQQRQDWITHVLVTTLASGVDAYVAAHLADFPARVDASPRTGGGFEVQLTVPTSRRRR